LKPLHWTIGDVRVTRVVESEAPLPPQGLIPAATPEALAPHRAWLEPHFLDEQGQFILAIQGLVIESAGSRILVDTCLGDRDLPFEIDGERRFLEDLAEAGFPKESIDLVMCTHLHFDHVGWNTVRQDGRWVPTFPNARYLFGRLEYDHWRTQSSKGEIDEYAYSFADAVEPIVDAGLADLVEMDHRLTEHVRLEATPGHTPGHVAVRIDSAGEQGMITGDLTHHPVQWGEPDWGMPADSDSHEAAETRRRLLAEHADTPLLVIGTHYASPCAGRLVRRGSGFAFEAMP